MSQLADDITDEIVVYLVHDGALTEYEAEHCEYRKVFSAIVDKQLQPLVLLLRSLEQQIVNLEKKVANQIAEFDRVNRST